MSTKLVGFFGFAVAFLLIAFSPANSFADTLHGFCVAPTPVCSDNGAITPVNSASPTFGFWAASGPLTGNDRLAILIPNNKGPIANFTVNVTNGGPLNNQNFSVAASLFSMTPWSSGQLDAYLGINASPTN